MLKDNAQAELEDGFGENPVTFDVNFDKEHPDYIKISIGDKSSIVRYTDLFALMFTLATKEQQAKMIPVTEELGVQYMKKIKVRLKHDVKAGDFVVVNVPINIKKVVEDEIIREFTQKENLIPSPYLTPGLES